MMKNATLPQDVTEFMEWPWERMQPYYQELQGRPLDEANLAGWLADWSHMRKLVDESFARLQLANNQDTSDEGTEGRYYNFLEKVYPSLQAADQALKEKLLASGLEPEGFQVTLRNMHTETGLFREANLPLIAEEHKLGSRYNKIIGAQTVVWEGEEVTPQQLNKRTHASERETRAAAWRLVSARQLADREAINRVWEGLLEVRRALAENAGYTDYRAFRWQQLLRFDYTPEDCYRFHDAIEEVVTPVATRLCRRRARHMGVDSLRPWDLDQDVYIPTRPALPSYGTVEDLESKAGRVFRQVDPALGSYFETMRAEKLLDLPNRKGKSPGAFCTSFATQGRPFIFMNATGLPGDIRTLLHESGHAFHVFERTRLPYHHQWRTSMEFSEVASFSMELLGAPFLGIEAGGYYSATNAARLRLEILQKFLLFWPYMAMVDAFQHWVYENHSAAQNPEVCDEQWAALQARFIPGVDWSGLEQEMMTGWQRKLHIHRAPFYYVEYGMAQLGAMQIWQNSMQDRAGAVTAYRRALSLGYTRPLPELYQTAGAKFAFDAGALRQAVELLEREMEKLEAPA